MATLPMFPLGAVLFPHMPLQLRVFEPRYAVMLSQMLRSGSTEFGVVLIERGQEVGGGEQRFGSGTVAQIIDLKAQDQTLLLAARGTRRIEVSAWLEEVPYPQAEVSDLPELAWEPALEGLRDRAERLVRRTLALASEFEQATWPPDIDLADDPLAAAWQLAGIAPISSLDQVGLLTAGSLEELLTRVIEHTAAAAETLTAVWPDED
ncbi:MAG: LON peptidase substrate-binding domain-containing protein [Actinomycetes bacterium]